MARARGRVPARGRRRWPSLGRCREGLPARDGQPRVPHRPRRRTGRRGDGRPVRLEGQRDRPRGDGILELPHAVRRLGRRTPGRPELPRPVLAHAGRVQGRLRARRRSARGAPPVRGRRHVPPPSRGPPDAHHDRRQRAARGRRREGVPGRARLCPPLRHPRLDRCRRLRRLGRVPAPGRQLHIDGRRQGARLHSVPRPERDVPADRVLRPDPRAGSRPSRARTTRRSSSRPSAATWAWTPACLRASTGWTRPR